MYTLAGVDADQKWKGTAEDTRPEGDKISGWAPKRGIHGFPAWDYSIFGWAARGCRLVGQDVGTGDLEGDGEP